VEANLFVGETRPYPTGSSYGGTLGGFSSIQQLQIGITLSVLPLINADGLVVMDIRQRIQNVGENVTIENIGEVPTTVDREANAKVAVRDRETIMLGGFISSDRSKSKNGVPFLQNIPLLGFFFRGQSDQDIRRELIVLIRPTVLPTPSEAAEMAQSEKAKLPGIMEAERDYLKSEQEKLDRFNQELYDQEGFKK
jgi:general secretion pathway protein D